MNENSELLPSRPPAEPYFSEHDNSIFEDIFPFSGRLNPAGSVLDLRGRVFDETNINPALLTGQKFSETVFWQSSEHTAKQLEEAIAAAAAGRKAKVVLDFRVSSEKKLCIELNLYPVKHAGLEEIFFCAYDVTGQRKQTDHYRQRSEQLLYAAESAEIGLWSWDLTDNTVYSTPKCNELFAAAPNDEMTYDSFVAVVHPEDRPRVEAVLEASQNNGTEYNEQFRVNYPNGTIEWIAARGKAFLDDEGHPLKMMGVVRQITDQKHAEVGLSRIYDREKRARDEAEEANRAKDFFLAFVSHELRSPLNAILGWSKILLSKKVDAETQKSALETIERSARAQAKLINDLVDSARIASGKLSLEFRPVNLYEIVRAVYHSQEPAAGAKRIKLEFTHDGEEVTVFGDSNRLQQVFNNLLSNAIKFTAERGAVSVDLRTRDGRAEVSVADDGQGISPDSLPNVFRQFSQGEETAADKIGLGLGLSIVKILVEKHSGTVTAASEGTGRGASFTVTLPLSAPESDGPAPAEEPTPAAAGSGDKPLRGIKVLLVEDDNDSREVLGLFLEQCGAKVMLAEAARTAMSVLTGAAKNLPHVIISDLAMPDEDGYSLINRIRRLSPQTGGNIPAIALSAFATNENKQKAFELGFQKYNTKPFEPDLLVADILSLVKN